MKSIWFGFGFDPINERFIVLTIAATKQEAETKCREGALKDSDIMVWRAFDIVKDKEGVWQWMRDCKIPDEEIKDIFNELANSLEGES